jgi:hypothetical protein
MNSPKLKHKKISRDEYRSIIFNTVCFLIDQFEFEEGQSLDVVHDELCDMIESELESVMDIPDYNYN